MPNVGYDNSIPVFKPLNLQICQLTEIVLFYLKSILFHNVFTALVFVCIYSFQLLYFNLFNIRVKLFCGLLLFYANIFLKLLIYIIFRCTLVYKILFPFVHFIANVCKKMHTFLCSEKLEST